MIPALPAPAKLPIPPAPVVPVVAHAGLVDGVVGETVGNVGANGVGTTGPTTGNTLGTGTAGVELTPRLPISKDPNGSPVRAPPPGAVGEVDVGLDDEAMLLEPEPHIPDIPDVSSAPGDPVVTGISDVTGAAGVAEDIDVPGIAMVPDDTAVPEFAAVAGGAVPTPIPPPSKLAADPNISEGEVATAEHAVAPLVAGIVIVPVTPVGTGLTPGEVISMAPSGMPVGEPGATPSGEVAPTIGVGVTVPSNGPSTCAMAALQMKSAGSTVATRRSPVSVLRLQAAVPRRSPLSIDLATGSLGVRLSNIGQSWLAAHGASEKSAAADAQFVFQRLVQLLLLRVERRKPAFLGLVRHRMWTEVLGSRLNANRRRFGRSRVRRFGERIGLGNDAI